MSDDLVLDFLRRVLELYPETPESAQRDLEIKIRQHWGGTAVYIRKAAPPKEKAARLAVRLAAGADAVEAARAIGVHRTTGWRLRRRFA